jgi:hypothetical protein
MNRAIRGPLSDSIIVATAHLVHDAQAETREPSHSDLTYEIERAGLASVDPNASGKPLGKAKRVRTVLNWAYEHDSASGERLVAGLISHIRGCGGFRETSSNFVGLEAIQNARAAFAAEGYDLGLDGDLRPRVLDGLSEAQLSEALRAYVRRAKRGSEDAALVAGTSKDLLEAVAAHALVKLWGTYPSHTNFPGLLGQAFTALGLATSQDKPVAGEPAQKGMERALYELGCAVNRLRNRDGTGHGRPFLPSVTADQARSAVESMGVVAEYILNALEKAQ